MKKKLLFFAIVMGISAVTFAQVTKKDAQEAVEKEQKALLNEIKTGKGLSKIDWGRAKKQFFVLDTVKSTGLDGKEKEINPNDNISKVCEKIDNVKNNFGFKFEQNTPSSIVGLKLVKGGLGKNKKDYKKLAEGPHYTVTVKVPQCSTTISDRKSNKLSKASYDVTFIWSVGLKYKGEKQRISYVKLRNIKAEEHVSNEKENLSNATKAAEQLIQEWYNQNANSAAYFSDKIKRDVAVTAAQPSQSKVSGVKINGKLQQQIVVEDNLPTVVVSVDSTKYLSEESFYVDKRSYYTFRPKFTITFVDNDYKKAEITKVDFDSTFTMPKTMEAELANKVKAMEGATKTKSDLQVAFANYSQEPNAENTKKFKSLFVDNNDTVVQVSVIEKDGKIRREKTRRVSQYVSNLKGATVEIEQMDEPVVNVKDEPWSATVDFIQKTTRDAYCDHTKKKMYMVKDKDGNFKISKIEVLEDPTPCEQ